MWETYLINRDVLTAFLETNGSKIETWSRDSNYIQELVKGFVDRSGVERLGLEDARAIQDSGYPIEVLARFDKKFFEVMLFNENHILTTNYFLKPNSYLGGVGYCLHWRMSSVMTLWKQLDKIFIRKYLVNPQQWVKKLDFSLREWSLSQEIISDNRNWRWYRELWRKFRGFRKSRLL